MIDGSGRCALEMAASSWLSTWGLLKGCVKAQHTFLEAILSPPSSSKPLTKSAPARLVRSVREVASFIRSGYHLRKGLMLNAFACLDSTPKEESMQSRKAAVPGVYGSRVEF